MTMRKKQYIRQQSVEKNKKLPRYARELPLLKFKPSDRFTKFAGILQLFAARNVAHSHNAAA